MALDEAALRAMDGGCVRKGCDRRRSSHREAERQPPRAARSGGGTRVWSSCSVRWPDNPTEVALLLSATRSRVNIVLVVASIEFATHDATRRSSTSRRRPIVGYALSRVRG